MDAFLLRRPVFIRPANAGVHCLTCGDRIPEARRRALPGCCNCFGCQEVMERAMGR